ncbi:MAG: PQQ-binding-like beta-propeller repeat protein, partial [Pyrinomonadaceae bacterium]
MKTRSSFKGAWQFFTAALVVGACLSAQALRPHAAAGQASPPKEARKVAETPQTVRIDLSKAVKVSLPKPAHDLQPASFRTDDGREGWVVRIPGGRPLATPAYSKGRLFVGGGYGSHEFYAFEAKTGRLVWKTNTGDDGPTAAVIEDGLVAFNTESCTLVVVDEQTGKMVWQEWLGDPLMSQPAVSKGRLYMAYPGGGRGPAQQQNMANHTGQSAAAHIPPQPVQGAPKKEGTQDEQESGSHRLLCADLKTGRHLWERAISSDVISAPVISDGHVYATTFDGTSYSFDAATGELIWKKENAGTSAPVVVGDDVHITQ